MLTNVARKPARADVPSGCASVTAATSSITPCAASSRPAPRASSCPASRRPYSAFLLPSSIALAVPAARLPPAATAPASANCEAPVKASRLSTHAWAAVSPELTAAAPNARPEVPTAMPRASPSLTGLPGLICHAGTLCAGRPAVLVRSCRPAGPLPLVGTGRDADHPLEVPGQVRLVGEAGLGGHLGWRQPGIEQPPGQPHSELVEVGVRGQAGRVPERPQQRERAHPGRHGQLVEAGGVGEAIRERIPHRADHGR